MQAQVHPDHYSSKSALEKRISEQQSSEINKAFQILKDPLSRAQYLLSLNGIEINESLKTQDKQFLMEIIELQEEIEDLEEDQVQDYVDRNNQEINTIIDNIGKAFKSNDLELAKKETIRLKYYYQIRNKLHEIVFKYSTIREGLQQERKNLKEELNFAGNLEHFKSKIGLLRQVLMFVLSGPNSEFGPLVYQIEKIQFI
ncbi:hypothetical protein HK103_004871 [Boothiomyces macroporosus]|uniref:Co-chaperone HscB C-terminal oligomerisation domain-containing protein n=1 Tax=Boothiomyces macroporosus TaxID=261099 RepID=A0AAD5UG08_9FUNG|nr:hypothetical protein HK103_004871 [Boothiomyces macroporosus]